MVNVSETAKREDGYSATRFLQMVAYRGGVETARQLLHASSVSEGFTAPWLAKRLDLSVEAHVLTPEFAPLFAEAERDIARRRLTEYGHATEAI